MEVNIQDNTQNQHKVLHVASSCGHFHVVKSLLDASANPNIVNDYGQSPLSLASQKVIPILQTSYYVKTLNQNFPVS